MPIRTANVPFILGLQAAVFGCPVDLGPPYGVYVFRDGPGPPPQYMFYIKVLHQAVLAGVMRL